MAIPRLYEGLAIMSLTNQRPFPLLYVAVIKKNVCIILWNGVITTTKWGLQMLRKNIGIITCNKIHWGEIFYPALNF